VQCEAPHRASCTLEGVLQAVRAQQQQLHVARAVGGPHALACRRRAGWQHSSTRVW
jgi:hypothetical protein